MEKILLNLSTKILKQESKCLDIINTLSLIGKTVHLKDNSKSVQYQKLPNKLNLKLLEEFSSKNQHQNKIKNKNQKTKISDPKI